MRDLVYRDPIGMNQQQTWEGHIITTIPPSPPWYNSCYEPKPDFVLVSSFPHPLCIVQATCESP